MSHLIILDVDETLIYSEFQDKNPFAGIVDDVAELEGCFCAIRPHLQEFFDFLKAHKCLVMIYSAGSKAYVDSIASYMEHRFQISFFRVLTRDDCIFNNKSVSKYKPDFDSPQTILVDDRTDVGQGYTHLKHLVIPKFEPSTKNSYQQDSYLLLIRDRIKQLLIQ